MSGSSTTPVANLWQDIMPFVQRHGGTFLTQANDKLPHIMKGLGLAWRGSMRGVQAQLRTPEFRQFMGRYTISTLVLYGIFTLACFTILAPLAALALIFAPGLLVQAFMTLSHFSFEFTSHQFPGIFSKLFLAPMKSINPREFETVTDGLKRNPDHSSFLGWIEQRAARWWHFAKASTILSVAGFVPLLGPVVASFGQWIKNSEEFAFSLLEPWFRSMGWNNTRKSRFVSENKWLLIGFALPFTLLNSIPLVNVFSLGIAQGAAATLVSEGLLPITSHADQQFQQETAATSNVTQKNTGDLTTGTEKGQVAETTKAFEPMDMGTIRQSMAGPTLMEKDLSDELRHAAGIPTSERLTPKAKINASRGFGNDARNVIQAK